MKNVLDDDHVDAARNTTLSIAKYGLVDSWLLKLETQLRSCLSILSNPRNYGFILAAEVYENIGITNIIHEVLGHGMLGVYLTFRYRPNSIYPIYGLEGYQRFRQLGQVNSTTEQIEGFFSWLFDNPDNFYDYINAGDEEELLGLTPWGDYLGWDGIHAWISIAGSIPNLAINILCVSIGMLLRKKYPNLGNALVFWGIYRAIKDNYYYPWSYFWVSPSQEGHDFLIFASKMSIILGIPISIVAFTTAIFFMLSVPLIAFCLYKFYPKRAVTQQSISQSLQNSWISSAILFLSVMRNIQLISSVSSLLPLISLLIPLVFQSIAFAKRYCIAHQYNTLLQWELTLNKHFNFKYLLIAITIGALCTSNLYLSLGLVAFVNLCMHASYINQNPGCRSVLASFMYNMVSLNLIYNVLSEELDSPFNWSMITTLIREDFSKIGSFLDAFTLVIYNANQAHLSSPHATTATSEKLLQCIKLATITLITTAILSAALFSVNISFPWITMTLFNLVSATLMEQCIQINRERISSFSHCHHRFFATKASTYSAMEELPKEESHNHII